MKPKIIYEDKDIIVIDKPAGITVHAVNNHDNKPTIVGLLSKTYPEIKNVGDPSTIRQAHGGEQGRTTGSGQKILRPGIVHRLDKETSGLMVVAKNNETFYELKKQFQQKKVEKKYIALVSGRLERDSGTIDIPLMKIGTRSRISNFKFLISKQTPKSKSKTSKKLLSAITEYKTLKRYKDYTLVEVAPKTGRMHQIRVHFASINHPLACDKLYGRKAKKCPTGLKRHFLHASYLKFRIKNALMVFDSELPEDLKKTLELL